jgi:chitinase
MISSGLACKLLIGAVIGAAVTFASLALSACASADTAPAAAPTPNPNIWVTGYYLSGDIDTGRYPVSKVDFHAFTHIIQFCNFPGPDGTLDPARTIPLSDTQALLGPAHAAGVKVLVSLGSDDVNLRPDISGQWRDKFCHTLVDFVVDRGYDGLDLDYEPLEDQDVPDFTAFVATLRNYMNTAKPGLLLTAAVASEPQMFGRIYEMFDQINLMTYELSGPFPGFRSWYNSNLYGDPSSKMEDGSDYPSSDQMIKQFISAGVPASKLAVGIAFGGHIWTGVSGPRQSLKGYKFSNYDDGDDYRALMDQYYSPAVYHWDPVAHASYLSIPATAHSLAMFIPYDGDRDAVDKVAYAKQKGLGGVMIWEIGAGYRPNQPAGSQDVPLQAIKQAWLGTTPPAGATTTTPGD